MAPGDLLFSDNHKLAQAREAYQDEPSELRLMDRPWLYESCTPLDRGAMDLR